MAIGRPDGPPPVGRGGTARSQPRVSIRYDGGGTATLDLNQARVGHFAGSVPWRRWRSRRGQAHLSGMYWAATTGGHVVYESRLELARLLLADFDPRVDRIWAQPALLEAVVAGRARRHVPDFLLVSVDDVATVVNVKPAELVADPKIAAALAWPQALVSGHGWEYEVWSGCDPVVLENVRFLAAYRRPGLVDEDLVTAVDEQVHDGEPLGEAEIRLAHGAPGWIVRPLLLTLLWRHRLVTDLTRPLSSTAVLHRADPACGACGGSQAATGAAAAGIAVGAGGGR